MASTRQSRSRAPKRQKVEKPISDIAPEETGMTQHGGDGNGSARSTAADTRQPDRQGDDEIRRRAYRRYEERGRIDGRAEEDWFAAEQELRSRR